MKTLIVVDVQNDFCPGGSLAVEDGDRIIPNINVLMTVGGFDKIIATQDWHPATHISFAINHSQAPRRTMEPFTEIDVDYGKQMLWPMHCVYGTPGADFRPSLNMNFVQFIVRKGYRPDVDSYSGFLENDKKTRTGMDGLIEAGTDIYICGIATDVCVFNTAMDVPHFHDVYVIEDACAGVTAEGTENAIKEMKKKDINIVKTEDLLPR